jgi:hypothetical protein
MIVIGWFTVCGASYSYENADFFDFSTRAGKQLVWICCSLGIAFILMMLDDDLYEIFSYLIYAVMIVLLIVTLAIATETKGSRSWLDIGPFRLQPAEFAKFATALAVAKLMSSDGFSVKKWKDFFKSKSKTETTGSSKSSSTANRTPKSQPSPTAARTPSQMNLGKTVTSADGKQYNVKKGKKKTK